MKDKIANLLNKFKSTAAHDDIGMAVHEEDDPMHEHNHGSKEKLAVAQSTKERIIEKVRGNLVYIVIAILVIIPGLFKLIGFFQEPQAPSNQIAQTTPFGENAATPSYETLLAQNEMAPPASASGFPEEVAPQEIINTTPVPEAAQPEEIVSTTPVPEQAPAEEPVETTPIPEEAAPEEPINTAPFPEAVAPENAAKEPAPAGNASRSMLANLFSFGGGSEEPSGNMSEKGNQGIPSTQIASIPGAVVTSSAKSQTAEQILQGYQAQETKVEDQLSEIIARMDKLETHVAAVKTLEERLARIETSDQESNAEQLAIVQNKLVQLEQGMMKLSQQAAKTTSVAVNVPQNTAQPQQTAMVSSAVTVEAVIPGRAWVRNQDGVLMVVQVGDEITGVGKVTRIDAREGTVATARQIFKQ